MLRKILFVCLFLGSATVFTKSAFADSTTLQSPDKKLTLTVNSEPELSYTVQYDGKEIVAPSKLGVKFKDEAVFGAFGCSSG